MGNSRGNSRSGACHQWIEVGNPANGEFQWVNALADTGASHSIMPESFLTQTLHLSPAREATVNLADNSRRRFGRGEAKFRIEGQELHSPVIFGPEGRYLLGASTLQIFDLAADTTHHRLIPTPEITI